MRIQAHRIQRVWVLRRVRGQCRFSAADRPRTRAGNGHSSAPAGRNALEEETGISAKLILKWCNHADLFRVKGVGPQFAELLEAAGVDTVKELAHRNAENLAAKMLEVNEEKHLVRRVPVVKEIQKMIDCAKELPGTMTY